MQGHLAHTFVIYQLHIARTLLRAMSARQGGVPPASDALHRAVSAGDVHAVQLLAAHEELLNRSINFEDYGAAVTPLEVAVFELVGGGWRRENGSLDALCNASCRFCGMLLAGKN